MALGRRNTPQQGELWVATPDLPKSPGHVFYEKLNGLLAETDFDAWVEERCRPYYREGGRPSIPPGVYFRMLLVGYFEGIGSQRGIAWRCSDSLSLRKFLGLGLTEESPHHSSLSVVRDRLPLKVHEAVFTRVLAVAEEKGLLKGRTIAVDSTTLEANAAMKSIVRKDTGEDWREYVTKLMREEGVIGPDETPDIPAIKRFDRARKNKKVSNDEWESPADPDSRITRMKDGTTHLAYKAEHAVDLETEMIVAAEIYHATEPDSRTLEDTAHQAQLNLQQAGSDTEIQDLVADKAYHSIHGLGEIAANTSYRTYVPEPQLRAGATHTWTDRPEEHRDAAYANRRRTRGARGKRLQRQRSEQVERTFAHVCETGGARRTWLRTIEKVQKRYLIAAAAHNLGRLMRALFGMGTPRGLQKAMEELLLLIRVLWGLLREPPAPAVTLPASNVRGWDAAGFGTAGRSRWRNGPFSTGC